MSRTTRKKTPRSKVKHPGLKKRYNSKLKQEYLDQDYISKLSEDEKQFLSDFNEEYYGANLDFKNLENNRFHKTKEEKKTCTDRNNARNRCIYGIAKATNRVLDVENPIKEEPFYQEDEDSEDDLAD